MTADTFLGWFAFAAVLVGVWWLALLVDVPTALAAWRARHRKGGARHGR